MKNLYTIFLSCFCLLSVACKKDSNAKLDTVALDTEISLELGETVILKNTELKFRFEELVEYSICPPQKLCKRDGRAWIRIGVREMDFEMIAMLDLITENSIDQDTKVSAIYDDTYKITLISLEQIDSPTEYSYKATIKIEEI